jgi:hypothetical protein
MFVCKYQTQTGRELRKPVEWLIAAVRATTIELQGSTEAVEKRVSGRRPTRCVSRA